jgi:hypothetical protein
MRVTALSRGLRRGMGRGDCARGCRPGWYRASSGGAPITSKQAPRSQDVQAPRSAELTKAATLVKEADAACNAGNSAMATEKAMAAIQLLKK